MKECKIERVDMMDARRRDTHHQIIEKYLKDGYSYVNYIPLTIGNEIKWIDLIFEKEVDED